jgi:hypothetical protein
MLDYSFFGDASLVEMSRQDFLTESLESYHPHASRIRDEHSQFY